MPAASLYSKTITMNFLFLIQPLLPPGPLEMIPENQDDNNEPCKGFLQTWAEVSKVSLGMAYHL
jgi:hypothetical protein